MAWAVATMAATGCSDSFNASEATGEGRLLLRPSVSADMNKSRALTESDITALEENCIIWISGDKGLVRKYEGIANVPADAIPLMSGNYMAEAWAGDSVPASFESRYFKGAEKFVINKGGTTQVNLLCKVANTAVTVTYAEGIDEVLSDYTFTVGHSCGSLVWEGRDTRRGYFMMNSRDKALAYKLSGKLKDGTTYTCEGVIEAVKPATEYIVNIKYNAVDVSTGGAFFTIEVDETTIDVEDSIQIIAAPSIVGVYQSLDEPVYGEAGKMTRQSIYVAAAAPLKAVTVEIPSMVDQLGDYAKGFDLIRAEESVLADLRAKGIVSLRTTDEANGLDNLKIALEPDLLNLLGDGTYEVTVTATLIATVPDGEGGTKEVEKTNSGKMTLIVTDADVQAQPLSALDPAIWATEVTLTGTVMKDGVEAVGFNYREKGTAEWTAVDGTLDAASRVAIAKGTTYHAVLTGLTPGTTYEYVATAGAFVSAVVNEFTTESADQLPNAGFEDWCKSSDNVQLIAPSADNMFWDSGNHGAKIASATLTEPESNLKHSGNYSACLRSKKVIIAVAAGNLFIGKYLDTEGTNGVLGWGRPWSTRPRALRGYIKYTPQAIDNVKGAPAGVTVNKGDMDAGIIYIALLDGNKQTFNSYSWPVIVRTKDLTNYSFDSGSSSVIGYGEKVFTEATAGDGLIEFEIPIDYMRSDVKVSNIMVVASASRYGDYFTGGANSVMYLDDLELVY